MWRQVLDVVDGIADCYAAVGIVHTKWPFVPGRFKDYISTPKQNDYRSIHSTVIGPGQQRVELQFRTREMHEIRQAVTDSLKSVASGSSVVTQVGTIIEITPENVKVGGKIESGYLYVDGATVGDVGDVVIRDRKALSRDGSLMVIVTVDRETGVILAGPEIATRGFVHAKESSQLLDDAKAHHRQVD